ncbi:Fe2+-dependent dioxygenase [Lysobacteraceae bacterium NML120232]|nr:Fe2+-dependent dioxygenase [Xanthomonadaceae bacterium NML08-0793]PJK09743.1 Fe2+-dependent dioxygenase [Xanthomonadaceae bacterium NML120232]
MMLHIPEILSAEEVRQMRAALTQADWVDGRQSVGGQGAQVKRNRQLAENCPLRQQLGQRVQQALHQNPLFFSAALPLRYVPPYFNMYEGGEHYGLHVDGAIRSMTDGTLVRTDMSFTLFLCDPEEYEGGELVVVDTYGSHEVKLPAGDVILYTSGSLHQVLPVTRGARLCAFSWLQSLIADDEERRMLFELDQTIQSLRQKQGESQEAVALTAHYHNLLRRWARG